MWGIVVWAGGLDAAMLICGVEAPRSNRRGSDVIWRNMDTAPRDGREILALVEDQRPVVVFWSDWLEEHWQPLGQPWRAAVPTRWAPLPALPPR